MQQTEKIFYERILTATIACRTKKSITDMQTMLMASTSMLGTSKRIMRGIDRKFRAPPQTLTCGN